MGHGLTATDGMFTVRQGAPPDDAQTKFCPRCEVDKQLDDFPISASGTFGRYGYCKPCKAAYMRERKQAQKIDGRLFEENLLRTLRRYGVDLKWYQDTLIEQMGCCAVCGGAPDERLGRFCIDHDHQTGIARGLLCSGCNKGIGALADDPDNLRRAAAYLDLHHAKRSI